MPGYVNEGRGLRGLHRIREHLLGHSHAIDADRDAEAIADAARKRLGALSTQAVYDNLKNLGLLKKICISFLLYKNCKYHQLA